MAEPTDVECAYFAGFFDGEGCVAAYERRYVVCLSNTDVRPLVRAMDLWGGSLSRQLASSRQFAVRDLWRLHIYGQKSRAFLTAIRPFIILKAEQVDVFLTLLDLLPRGRGQRRVPGTAAAIDAAKATLRLLKVEGA